MNDEFATQAGDIAAEIAIALNERYPDRVHAENSEAVLKFDNGKIFKIIVKSDD